jgi:hypothetical protein
MNRAADISLLFGRSGLSPGPFVVFRDFTYGKNIPDACLQIVIHETPLADSSSFLAIQCWVLVPTATR